MLIFPAIDLYEKKVVRLYKGDYNNMTIYSENPLAVAHEFESKGAGFVHLVDLEGARNGTTPNIDVVKEIAQNTGLFCEIGGGIRNTETVEKYISAGVNRVILGTAAIENRDFLIDMISEYGEKIAVGADIKDGCIAVKGWIEKTDMTLEAFMDDMQKIGVETVICTDISKDGAMRGTNLELYAALSKKYKLNITASGGVSSIEDVKKLREMNIHAAIIGKAYYTGDIDLTTAIEVAQ